MAGEKKEKVTSLSDSVPKYSFYNDSGGLQRIGLSKINKLRVGGSCLPLDRAVLDIPAAGDFMKGYEDTGRATANTAAREHTCREVRCLATSYNTQFQRSYIQVQCC